ncbi:MAG: hypothetical protein KAS32_03520 [Candidatus Peribacteraceae bacterium]|nr:hypothetical protein [Candidatus Peribacteraceae bacterium]
MVTNSMYEQEWNSYPIGNPGEVLGLTTGLREQLGNAGYKDVANNEKLWFDHFATNPDLSHQFIYIHNSGYSDDAGLVSVEFVNGLDKYNPKTYQLFSVGIDGKTNVSKNASMTQDNIWAIPGANAVKIFRDAKDQQGK